MFTEKFMPRFSDTDALGHINNTMVPVWFEGAREPVFRLFTPDLDVNNWRLIIAKIEVEYLGQMYLGQEIEIRTYFSRLGKSSFDVYQEVWQHNELCARGTAVSVHFNYQTQSAEPIPDDIRNTMLEHMFEN